MKGDIRRVQDRQSVRQGYGGDVRLAEAVPVLLLALALWQVHTPGVFAYDSLLSWNEGRIGRFTSNQPPLLGWLWHQLDQIGQGASLLVLLNASSLCAGAYLALRRFCPPAIAIALLALIVCDPPVFAQTGIINKETLACHLLLCASAIWAHARLDGRSPAANVLAAMLTSGAILLRYQYVVVAGLMVFGTALGWTDRRLPRWHVPFLGTAIRQGILLAALLGGGVLLIDRTAEVDWRAPIDVNYRNQIQYELAALIAAGGDTPLDLLARADVDTDALRAEIRGEYTPDSNVDLRHTSARLRDVPTATLAAEEAVLREAAPWGVSLHRLATFEGLLGLRKVCWPVQKRILRPDRGSDEARWAAEVDLAALPASASSRIFNHRLFPANIFLFRPIVYVLAGVAALAWIVSSPERRRRWGCIAMLPISGLAYTLSFLPVTPSCDFRYLYWLVLAVTVTLAAMLGGAVAAWRRRRSFP